MFGFNKYQSAEKFENERKQLFNDYQLFTKVEASDKLKSFLELKKETESQLFQSHKKDIEALAYKGSNEEKLEKEFLQLDKNRKIKRYFVVEKSAELKRFTQLNESKTVARHAELEKFATSGQYKSERKEFKKTYKKDKSKRFEDTDTAKKFTEYTSLKNSEEIRFYLAYPKSSDYKTYKALLNSQSIKRFIELNEKVNSADFQKQKAYLVDKTRYQKTDDYKKLEAYEKLKADSDILLYLKYKDCKSFDFFRNWVPVFDEDFNSKLNTGLWDSISIHGENGPGRNFSLNGELQYHTSAKNTLVSNSVLTLQTRKEKTEGLAWDATKGFVPTTFNYSSAYLHSLKSYKQKFGYLEIKVKARSVNNIVNSIALTNESRDVVVQVYTNTGKGIEVGTMRKERESNVIQPFRLKYKPSEYVIISLEWNANKLEWNINGKITQTITSNIPNAELGLEILSIVTGDVSESRFPYNFEIDWIRFYNLK